MPHKVNGHVNASEDMGALLERLTLDEKILLLSAKNIWETPAIERVGIPSLKVGKPSQFRYNVLTSS
jgi:beta-glucosidase